MSHSTLNSDSSIIDASASLKSDLKEKRALSRMRLVIFPDIVVRAQVASYFSYIVVRGPGGAWSYTYLGFDFEPSVDDYTFVCSDKPLTKPE
uniref:Uncharacterized protein n=1 Tax=Bird gammacoronavirus AnasCN24 TaxID=3237959 RepID=A0AB39ADU7_9GAMC